MDERKVPLNIWLSTLDRDLLRQRATAAGLSMSAYARWLIHANVQEDKPTLENQSN